MTNLKNVYTVIEPAPGSKYQKNFWQKVGVAFENKDGSMSVVLNCLPVNGKLQIREANELPKYDHGGSGKMERKDMTRYKVTERDLPPYNSDHEPYHGEDDGEVY